MYKKILVIVFLFLPLVVQAQSLDVACNFAADCKSGEICEGGTAFVKGVCKSSAPAAPASDTKTAGAKTGGVVSLDNPIKAKTVPELIGNIIQAALGVMGGLTLLMVIWGGSTWLTAAGSPEKISAGKNTMVWALLGAILVVSSYIIVKTLLIYFTPS